MDKKNSSKNLMAIIGWTLAGLLLVVLLVVLLIPKEEPVTPENPTEPTVTTVPTEPTVPAVTEPAVKEPGMLIFSPDGVARLYGENNEVTATYTGWDTAVYAAKNDVPWRADNADINDLFKIRQVFILDGVSPKCTDHWFNNCHGLTSVTIGNGVTSIGKWSFANCMGLTTIAIPNGITSIGDAAFSGCEYLTNVTIGNGVTSIGMNAFAGCERLTSLTIGNGVTSIGDFAFYNCRALTSITIPDIVTSIGDNAFCYCDGLTNVTLSNNLTNIGKRVFAGCSGLTSIGPVGSGASLEIPTSVTSIGVEAFMDCDDIFDGSGLTSVVIPDNVTSIGDYAFEFCSNLTSVSLHNGITRIGKGVFHGSKLTSIGLVGSGASLEIPNSVTIIDDAAFLQCFDITNVVLPNGITSIGDQAFADCRNMTSVYIPSSVTSIGKRAFAGEYNILNNITFEGTIAQWNAITKGESWHSRVPATVVHCSDGDVSLT